MVKNKQTQILMVHLKEFKVVLRGGAKRAYLIVFKISKNLEKLKGGTDLSS
jgi:hypothetical protein